MFERFTDRARRVVVLAQEEARLLGHNHIGTEHLLLGLIQEGEGVAARVLEGMGISLAAVRARVEGTVGRGEGTRSGHIPFTPRAKKVLELSLREALNLKHNYIGTEHILLGMLREGEGLAAQVLVELGADLTQARREVIRLLGALGPGTRTRAYPEVARSIATPAAKMVASQARRLAQGARVGSQHYLLGLLGEEQSLAAKVLTSLGVTRAAVEAKLAELDAAGTSDESPEDVGARRMSLRMEPERLVLEVDEPELSARLSRAAGGDVEVVDATAPAARDAFADLYLAVVRTVDELVRGLARVTAPFVPPQWDPGQHAAVYNLATGLDQPTARLDVSTGVDPVALRAWLRGWLEEERRAIVERAPAGGACSLVLVVDRAGESYRMFSFGVGDTGGARLVPVEELVDAALADLVLSRVSHGDFRDL